MPERSELVVTAALGLLNLIDTADGVKEFMLRTKEDGTVHPKDYQIIREEAMLRWKELRAKNA